MLILQQVALGKILKSSEKSEDPKTFAIEEPHFLFEAKTMCSQLTLEPK